MIKLFYSRRGVASRRERGAILVIAVLIMLVGALAAVVSLMTSRQNQKMSGMILGKRSAVADAQAAISHSLAKIRSDANWYTNDSANATKLYSSFNSDVDDPTGLPNCETAYTWTASDNVPAQMESSAGGKVICNYLGNEMPNVRVSIVRHKDYVDATNGNAAATYLITSIAKTSGGAMQKMQSVVLMPLTQFNWQYVRDPNLVAFIAATINVTSF